MPGLMITTEGPKLIEYNVRFGDPECQVLMLRLMSDLVPALLASRDGMLKSFDLRWYPQSALTVVMAAKGYPGAYARGSVIEGLDDGGRRRGRGNLPCRHQGRRRPHPRQRRSSARCLRRSGTTVRQAQARAYEAVARIRWPDGFYRHDIGWRAIEREV